jgi:zinc protease
MKRMRQAPGVVRAWRSAARAAAVAGALAATQLAGGQAAAVQVERVVSPRGIEAWLVEDHINPIISLRFAFRGGAALDPQGREGLAEMAAALLDEGAGALDSQAFQGRLQDLSIGLSFDAGKDSFGGSLRTLSENREEAFRLLSLALAEPRFDAEPVARTRQQMLVRLKRDAEDPDALANRALFETLFPGHPYGRRNQGTAESVERIAVDDFRRFVRERLARETLVVGVVGDVAAAELKRLLDGTFGGLPEKASPWAVADARPQGRGKTVVVRKPVPQSAIAFAAEGLKRGDPDFYALTVLNHVLGGGGFTSRLYAEVREKRGLAYSVGSSLYPLDRAGLIVGGAGTANARVGESVKVIRGEWERLARDGVSPDELADAKAYLTGSFPLRFSSSQSIAGMLVGMQLDGLGIDYFDRRNGLIEKVTRDDVNRLARTLLDPKDLTVVVVGEPEGLPQSE